VFGFELGADVQFRKGAASRVGVRTRRDPTEKAGMSVEERRFERRVDYANRRGLPAPVGAFTRIGKENQGAPIRAAECCEISVAKSVLRNQRRIDSLLKNSTQPTQGLNPRLEERTLCQR